MGEELFAPAAGFLFLGGAILGLLRFSETRISGLVSAAARTTLDRILPHLTAAYKEKQLSQG